jgi:hypothetical protein
VQRFARLAGIIGPPRAGGKHRNQVGRSWPLDSGIPTFLSDLHIWALNASGGECDGHLRAVFVERSKAAIRLRC